jgi:hypothetical protein
VSPIGPIEISLDDLSERDAATKAGNAWHGVSVARWAGAAQPPFGWSRDAFGSSIRRITLSGRAVYARSVILLEIGLIAAIVVFFIVADLYVRGCEKI